MTRPPRPVRADRHVAEPLSAESIWSALAESDHYDGVQLWEHPCRPGPIGTADVRVGPVRLTFDLFEQPRLLGVTLVETEHDPHDIATVLGPAVVGRDADLLRAAGALAILLSDAMLLRGAPRSAVLGHESAPDPISQIGSDEDGLTVFSPAAIITPKAAQLASVVVAIEVTCAAHDLVDVLEDRASAGGWGWIDATLAPVERLLAVVNREHVGRLRRPEPLRSLFTSLASQADQVCEQREDELAQQLRTLVKTVRGAVNENSYSFCVEDQRERLSLIAERRSHLQLTSRTEFEALLQAQSFARSALLLSSAPRNSTEDDDRSLCESLAVDLWLAAAKAWASVEGEDENAFLCKEAAFKVNKPEGLQSVSYLEQPQSEWRRLLAPTPRIRPSAQGSPIWGEVLTDADDMRERRGYRSSVASWISSSPSLTGSAVEVIR